MKDKNTYTAMMIDENITYTMIEISEQLNIPQALLLEMEEHGLFERKNINQLIIERIETACRLHTDLGINLPGVVLALELKAQLEELRQRIAILERQFSDKD